MKPIFITIFLSLFIFVKNVSGQQNYNKSFYLIDIKSDYVFDPVDKHDVDSILRLYHASKADSTRFYYLRLFSENLPDPYLWTRYNKYLYQSSLAKTDKLHLFYKASALNNLGYAAQYVDNDIEAAKKYYVESSEVYKSINNYDGLGATVNNLAYIYQHEGNTQKAIDLYVEAGKLFEKEDLAIGLTSIYINLGDIYFQNNESDKAEEFFNKALIYGLKTKKQLVAANVYNQLGAIRNKKHDAAGAIKYYTKSCLIYEKFKDYNKLSLVYLGLSNAYLNTGDTANYEAIVNKAYISSLSSPDLQVKAKVYNYVATLYIKKNDLKKALLIADTAYRYAKQIAYPDLVADAARNLSYIYKQTGNYKLAYDFLKEHKTLYDSINTNAAKNSIIKSQYQLEYNKKEIELKADQEKKDAVRQAEKRQQQLILIIVSIALLAIAVFGFIAFRNYRKVKKANLIIENQKHEVELKNEVITEQKALVDEKQKEIIDSINYAKRIQQAVLTGEDVWNKLSKEHFILFKPKDIVSGDFYWAYNTPNNRSVFALADCTGHGVPGGFMSMLGNSFLNEIVVENKIFKANEILNKLRSKIIHALEQKGQAEQKDGMDISLCVWNKIDNTLEFAGANNPLWLVRNVSPAAEALEATGRVELLEYKADKMPIGTYLETELPFTSVTIQLEKGDVIYLSTDGYADQFGGPKGKKFKYKPMIEMLIRNSGEPMEVQKEKLEIAHNYWKAEREQVDDICVIGIRV